MLELMTSPREASKEPLQFPFDGKKGTQVAAYILAKKGGKLEYLHLMKMLYAIDRIALAKWGQPVIGGHYASLKEGRSAPTVNGASRSAPSRSTMSRPGAA